MLFTGILYAQSNEQQIALEGATELYIFAACSSVTVTTGGTDAVAVHHTLKLDGTDRPDLRQLVVERKGGALHLREIKPTANLIHNELPSINGNQITGSRTSGKGTFNGVTVDATLEVTVPEGVKITVETDYGGIKTENVTGLVSARARYGTVEAIFASVTPLPNLDLYSNYGCVDLTLPAGRGANLDLTTEYGDLLTDLEIKIDKAASQEKEFYQRVIGTIGGGGNLIKCEVPYGDVYLREG